MLLLAWWTRKGAKGRLSVQADVKAPPLPSAGGLSMNQLVQFDSMDPSMSPDNMSQHP